MRVEQFFLVRCIGVAFCRTEGDIMRVKQVFLASSFSSSTWLRAVAFSPRT